MHIHLTKTSRLEKYKILNQAFTPRAIAWISTVSETGALNLAPFSFFGIIASDPIVFSVCIGNKRDGAPKDTLQNLLLTKFCTISFVNEKNAKKMDESSKDLDFGVSEAATFGIKMTHEIPKFPPVPEHVMIAFGCELHDIIEINSSQCVLVQASEIFIHDEIYNTDLNLPLENIGLAKKGYVKTLLLDPK